LPDTERVRDLWVSLWETGVWDIHPPSAGELCERALDGSWNNRGTRWRLDGLGWRFLAKTGMCASLAWSVPLYAAAAIGTPWWQPGMFTQTVTGVVASEPPSPRDLVERVLDGRWMASDERLLKAVSWMGVVLMLAWVIPLYALATQGQRFWRFITTALLIVLIWTLT
jgi:hypothetical protein